MNDTCRVKIDYGTCETATSELGNVQIVWKGNPLGRVNEGILKSIGFLYQSRDDAEQGVGKCATAFLVCVPNEEAVAERIQHVLPMGLCHGYVATASHVIRDGFTTLRIREVHGKVDILELPKQTIDYGSISPDDNAWICNFEGSDVAV
jgi:hypothetical protein